MFFFSANVFEKKFKINHKNTFKTSLGYFLVKIATPFYLVHKKLIVCSLLIKLKNVIGIRGISSILRIIADY